MQGKEQNNETLKSEENDKTINLDSNEGLISKEDETSMIEGDEDMVDVAEEELKIEEKLAAEIVDLKDKLVRSFAELENNRKRHAKELQDMAQYGIVKFASEMIEVHDNLERAIETAKNYDSEDANQKLKMLLEGIELTNRSMDSSLKKFGINTVEALHKKFDPNFHEALAEIEHAEHDSGTVVQEYQKGFKIGERLLRPAKVVIAK